MILLSVKMLLLQECFFKECFHLFFVIISTAEDTLVNLFIPRFKKALESTTQNGKNVSIEAMATFKTIITSTVFTPETAAEALLTPSVTFTELYKC